MIGPVNVRLRGLAKTGIAAGLDWTSLSSLVGSWRGLKDKPLVVGYHRVVSDFKYSDSLSISPMLTSAQTFEKHLDWIARRYRFVSLDELAVGLEAGDCSGKPMAAITFDDGYRDVYQNAFPILERKGIPSAVYVVTDLVGTRQLQVHDELHLLMSTLLARQHSSSLAYWRDLAAGLELSEQSSKCLSDRIHGANSPFQATRRVLETLSQSEIANFLQELRTRAAVPEQALLEFQSVDWEMLREMAGRGVTVGSHTRSHALLSNETPQAVRDEVEGSRQVLEQQLGVTINHFAYPDGKFNASVINAIAEAGYRTACTTCAHLDQAHPLLTISRRMLWEKSCMNTFGRFSPAILSCQVNGIFDPVDKCKLQHWA